VGFAPAQSKEYSTMNQQFKTTLTALVAVGAALASAPAQAAAPAVQSQTIVATRTSAPTCHRTLATYPVLRSGERRAAVRTLQCLLNDDDYGPLTVDGWYGPQTRSAIREVQKTFEGPTPPEHRYRIGRGMWTLLIARTLPNRTLKLGDDGRAVVVLQRALRAGGGSLMVDGDFGPQTRDAVRAFQRNNGLRATGRVNERTRFYLHGGAITSGNL
jgi:peptidoglycan hydrolase-like protein with peptidoglycan-binding domain